MPEQAWYTSLAGASYMSPALGEASGSTEGGQGEMNCKPNTENGMVDTISRRTSDDTFIRRSTPNTVGNMKPSYCKRQLMTAW